MASASRWSFGAQRWTALALLLVVLSVPSPSRAERFESLVVGPELRARERDGALRPPRYELSLPHGLHAAHGELMARLGLVLPESDGAPLAFPLTVGVRYLPLDGVLRPLLGADLGGYFTFYRGPGSAAGGSGADHAYATDARGTEWTWSVRALAGAQLSLSRLIALRLYGDAQWSELPEDPRARALFNTGFGAGCELSFTFSAPRLALLDMLLHGTNAPEGW